MVAMLAAIFVYYAHGNAMGARFEVARQSRHPDMRGKFGLHPRLLSSLIAGELLLDEGIRTINAIHLDRLAFADAIFDERTWTAVKEIDYNMRCECAFLRQ